MTITNDNSHEFQRLVAQETLIAEAQEGLCVALEGAGITRTELGARTGRSIANISQLMNGRRNLTLRTLADLLWALGYEATITINERGASSG